ncbi:hypothetical protein K470DRAFT_239065 [Piedraia hortae CBS 480.64]|uniref:Uncharacterized protein n=1 Tax=Piedraia hortae CBS 480.64 TaxID=1314780 RepID=A0A6A7CAM4_9PEZI|nr:hypothetical protein K470DRAFT_239065 [Piedraia hortae CBS 480.64]
MPDLTLARRGVEAVYRHCHPVVEDSDAPIASIVVLAVAGLLLFSIKYTLGSVVASLAMIESPGPIKIGDSEPLVSEKERAESHNDEIDVEGANTAPVTAQIHTAIRHLHSIGGFTARWRGLGLSILYHSAHAFLSNMLAVFLDMGILGYAFMYIFVSVGLARLHVLWTHSMISHPPKKVWFRRFVPASECRPLVIPSLVMATAEQATFILPIAVAFLTGLHEIEVDDVIMSDPMDIILIVLRFLAVPATALTVALAILLPASVTLTRIEAALLPEETIVPFDREAVLGENLAPRQIFVQAWRSFDGPARKRLVKLYAKMGVILSAVAVIAAELAVGLYMLD